MQILSIGLSPAIQKVYRFEKFEYGEVNRAAGYHTDAAGKCINVARVLHQSGCEAACLAPAGRENLKELISLCAGDGLRLEAVTTGGRTRTCTTLLDRNSGACTELIVGEPELITSNEEALYLQRFRSLLPEVTGAVVIAGSRLKGFSDKIIPVMVREIKKRGLLLFADYREKDLLNSFSGRGLSPDFVKINDREFLNTFPCDDLEQGLARQSLRLGCRFIISRGAESTLAAEEGRIIEIPSKTVRAVNPIGCGDAMTAGLAAGILEGLSLEEAVKKGRDYAARNAMSLRTGWILPDDHLSL